MLCRTEAVFLITFCSALQGCTHSHTCSTAIFQFKPGLAGYHSISILHLFGILVVWYSMMRWEVLASISTSQQIRSTVLQTRLLIYSQSPSYQVFFCLTPSASVVVQRLIQSVSSLLSVCPPCVHFSWSSFDWFWSQLFSHLLSFSTKPRDWLGRTSPKWPVMCRVGS